MAESRSINLQLLIHVVYIVIAVAEPKFSPQNAHKKSFQVAQ